MRMILKIFVWPVILLLGMLCFLGTIAYKVAAYVISPFLLLGLGCCIYCLVQARWMDLAIFAVIELGILLALFVMIGLVIHAENLRDWMRSLLSS
ncbi:hypothetical protein B5G28_09710 [Faecalibacterium sp. An77]|uniref:hypothetical protein n=1 Tax=Faecalibacterium sp. An77 TaxID=1965655 RepID=UPI000B39B4C2|nr:hypothetical protein [Faecalibacterium sp. An77]OUN38133.1 hypothetical protein B5G28_09710 [Faecalibacterium sp. An77]